MDLSMYEQLRERDQQIDMKDRLVEDLRQAIDNQRREAEELRRQQTELLYTNQEQARRLAELEALLHDMQSPNHHIHHRQLMHHERQRAGSQERLERHESHEGYVRERGRTSSKGDLVAHALALRQPEPARHQLLGGDRIDLSLQEFFDMHPDFDIPLTKHKPGWYTFDKPINKKVFIKMVGDQVIVRAGGGHVELHRWLEGFRSRAKGGDR
jgi:hypothetical protein